MKLIRICCLLILSVSVVAQPAPSARLIDSIEKSSCEDYMARSDNFGIELQKAPASKGILIWYGDGKEAGRLADIFAKFMHKMLINRFGNKLNVTVLRSTEKSGLLAEAWILPEGVDYKIPNSRIVAEIPFKVTRRTLYAKPSADPCSNYDFYGFANVLLSDSDLNAVIVNPWMPRSKRASDAVDIIEQFQELKVTRDRMRIFYQPKKAADIDSDYIELWLVPNKKR